MKTLDYVEGFVYENTTLSYYSMAEGRVRNTGSTLKYEYFIADHQGNVRVSFEEDNGQARIVQENHYYPFGLTMKGAIVRTALPTSPNKNLYNGGSELQDDFGDDPNLYSTFFREYDPVLGRMNGVDPMADKYSSWSPYNYSFNNPVNLNDPSGADPDPFRSGANPDRDVFWHLYQYDNVPDPDEAEVDKMFKEIEDEWRKAEEEKIIEMLKKEYPNSVWLDDVPVYADPWSDKDRGQSRSTLEMGEGNNDHWDELAAGWAIAMAEPTPIGELIMVVATSYVIYKELTGFGDRDKWTYSYTHPSQDPIHNPPNGFDPQKPPGDWRGPVQWTIFGLVALDLYESNHFIIIPAPIIIPTDSTTIVKPADPYGR